MPTMRKKLFYKESRLRFQCTGCGKCCFGTPGYHYIKVNKAEIERIRNHLGISRDWFRRRYLESLEAGNYGIRLNTNGACPFLGTDGNCAIYALRPLQCSTYPFWTEIVRNQANWQQEAKRCEGIDVGAVVPIRVIEKYLRESEE
jgi:Fe-S-cluster containining protein